EPFRESCTEDDAVVLCKPGIRVETAMQEPHPERLKVRMTRGNAPDDQRLIAHALAVPGRNAREIAPVFAEGNLPCSGGGFHVRQGGEGRPHLPPCRRGFWRRR